MAKMPKLMGKSSEKIWSYWSLQYEGKEEKEKNIWSPQWRSSESYQSWGTILRLLALDIQNLKLMVSRLFSLLCILTLWPIFVGQHFGPTFFAKPIRVGQIFFFFFIGMEWFMVVEPAFLNISLINPEMPLPWHPGKLFQGANARGSVSSIDYRRLWLLLQNSISSIEIWKTCLPKMKKT